MNRVDIMGRLTADPVIKNTASQIPYCQFAIAVDRKFKDQNGNRQTDFINCVAWRKTAELIGQYFKKGYRILISGQLQSRSYEDKNGDKKTVLEVLVDDIDFIEYKKTEEKPKQVALPDIPDNPDDYAPDLPFEF